MGAFLEKQKNITKFKSVSTIPDVKVLKIISSDFKDCLQKFEDIYSYAETGPVALPDFSLEMSSSISLKVVENVKKLGWIQLCK